MSAAPARPDAPDTVSSDTAVIRALRRLRVPQTQRNRELALLIFALALTWSAVALVQLGALGEINWRFLIYCGGLTALVVALHIVLRLVARDADPFVVPIATLLTGLGIAMIYRLDIAAIRFGWGAFSTRQLAWAGIAVVLAIAVVVLLKNYRVLFRYTYIFGFVGILLLVLPVIPGLSAGGNADVWVDVGFFTFQPGELAKLCLAIFFAGYLVRTRESLTTTGTKILGITWPRARELGPVLVFWLVSLGIIVLQRDLGTGLLIFGMFVAMLYVATGKTSWVFIGLVLVAVGAFAASRVLPYVQGRFTNWLDAFNPAVIDAPGGSYQLVQGIFGLAQGGLVGTGLGQGRPYLTPVAESDYILPSLGEEIGLIGVFAILCLYMVFTSRGIRIGLAGQDDFGKLLATGLSFTIALQVFIMVGGVTRVIPLTGLTTPFLAAGGSSLVANWIIVALLLRISDAVRSRPRVVIG
ncbi:FtsW/RodA/SpoVE family cell cycle protein [Microbacterium aurantiacum]|uniref:FtsW/RodA/SpoVE family cell cycle protein n=1 Tax=Microbacterium aurantiacum TaxID=162393 RepID=A0AAJ2LXV3_9MICO|nr:FtsW/RodA/SpoVE family cell cycle protein [Microbacterium aurantiacum]MBN9202571.1 FtsW/RodA/SpoVE family cell cycle protein [Microbacterium chocolatum]MDN4464737.1 FtsW/RodA/SpoVE family cell cycle protein [Microbacterium aurantiacum]MDS0244783.1 FtsW/RodA/SpoVE family cell cycle protein [Microbacterium aurantiacum]ODT11375.1 MAG: cell division protein FtsW [Microbacterium sp. SCN 70-18]